MHRDLIYDVGMHRGSDTKFYLDKGFRVVAVEAAPALAAAGRVNFAKEISEGRLEIVEGAIDRQANSFVKFYLHPAQDAWGSTTKGVAERGRGNSIEVTVPTITVGEIFTTHGVPYYLKCDIEGADRVLVEQLAREKEKPAFVSVEVTRLEDFDVNFDLGYDRAQIVNQSLHFHTRAPSPAREGVYVDARFDGHSSGLFGLELDPKKWITLDKALDRITRWYNLGLEDKSLALGRLDIHFTHASTLG